MKWSFCHHTLRGLKGKSVKTFEKSCIKYLINDVDIFQIFSVSDSNRNPAWALYDETFMTSRPLTGFENNFGAF